MKSPDASATTTVGSRGTGSPEPDSYADLLVGLWRGHPTRCGAWPVFCVVALFAGTAYPAERRYPIFPLRGKIALDGKLDEPAWQGAPWATDFLPLTPSEQIQQTRFKILYDASAFYLCAEVSERYLDALRTDKGDGEPVWQDDSLELFFQVRLGEKHRRVGVNAAGRRSDIRIGARASYLPAAYVLEIAIPFSVLGASVTPGTVIRGNICRNCLTTRDGKHSTWAPLGAQFHEPENFAQLHIRPEPISPQQVRQIEGLVNIVHSPTFLRGARKTAEAYDALLRRAVECDLTDRGQAAIVEAWKRKRDGALRYVAFFDYLTQKGSSPDFWEQDHSGMLAGGPCPTPSQHLRPVALTDEEQALDYHCRLEQLLTRTSE